MMHCPYEGSVATCKRNFCLSGKKIKRCEFVLALASPQDTDWIGKIEIRF